MLKDRLYYIDAYQKEFTAVVTGGGHDERGSYAILDNTVFYPTGGGQPHDTGTLNGNSVLDVEEVDSEVRHYVTEPLSKGTQVEGRIDWNRRWDHMQQHAGQHILTAAFVELFGIQTISFHLGKESVSIDLDVEEVTEEQLMDAEKVANQIILENRPIETKFVTMDELEQDKLRKALAVNDEIRLVVIPDYDYNGCGGTHPSSTGQVRAVSILSTERQKKKVRVHFVCGERVLVQLHHKNSILSQSMKQLSSPEAAVPDAIEKLLDTNKSLEKSLEEAREELLVHEANGMIAKQESGIVESVFTGRTIQELQKLAKLLVAQRADAIVFLISENGDKLQFVSAKGDAVDCSMKSVSEAALRAINGKGGGNDSFVQGGGERMMSGQELLSIMRSVL